MKIYTLVFFSSSEISIPLLKKLANNPHFKILALFTQPDKEFGRNKKIKKTAAKIAAEELEIKVYQPEKLSSEKDLLEEFKSIKPDFLLTFAYGQIMSQDWLELPQIAPINVHASLLPKYRGASPIQMSILNGDEETGVSVMKMVKKMDAGPFYTQHEVKVGDSNSDELFRKIAELSAELLPDDLLKIAEGLNPQEQDEAKATYCKKVSRDDGHLDFNKSSDEILRMFRAFHPWPGVWASWKNKRIKFLKLEKSEKKIAPTTVDCSSDIHIGTKDGSIKVLELQMESKKAMDSKTFLMGQKDICGATLL